MALKYPTGAWLAVVALFLSVQLAPLALHAASSSFTTSLTTFGVPDVVPPSVPYNLNASTFSSTQIDLSWTASTDNFAIAGYRIFRDSAFLATTSGTTYSDLGLAPETQYEYSVEAFDASMNLSGQSLPAFATTTAAQVVAPPPASIPPQGGAPGSGSNQFQIRSIKINPSVSQAAIAFSTTLPAQTKIFWGATPDKETGILSNVFYSAEHQAVLTGLAQDTQYYVHLEATDSMGTVISADAVFRTDPVLAFSQLPNPSDFTARPSNGLIHLTWTNPSDPRFGNVRIVRSESFFPHDQNDGVPVYEGPASLFDDRNVSAGQTYYYSIFAEGSDGSFSSGALAQARIVKPGEVVVPGSKDPFANIPESALTDPKIAALTLADFDFLQEGKLLFNSGHDAIAINGSENLTIRLAYDKVPEILKTIAITLTDPKDPSKAFPFLLRVNADKTFYEATIGALGRTGDYRMNVAVLDYQNQGLKRIQGDITALAFNASAGLPAKFDLLAFILTGLLLVSFVLLLMAIRHRKPGIVLAETATVSPSPTQL